MIKFTMTVRVQSVKYVHIKYKDDRIKTNKLRRTAEELRRYIRMVNNS